MGREIISFGVCFVMFLTEIGHKYHIVDDAFDVRDVDLVKLYKPKRCRLADI